jgi:hypothetical protein
MDLEPGWVVNREPAPSLNRHIMPENGEHEVSIACWCKPSIEGLVDRIPSGTIVRHRLFGQR